MEAYIAVLTLFQTRLSYCIQYHADRSFAGTHAPKVKRVARCMTQTACWDVVRDRGGADQELAG
jgi:hypothetical protein